MSTTTEKLGLFKPELTDAADITAMNPNWEKIDSLLADAMLKSATIIGGNSNLNNFTEVGVYTYSASSASTMSNVPENAQGTLLVLPRLVNNDPQNIIQIVISRENGVYVRNKYDGTWKNWDKCSTQAQVDKKLDSKPSFIEFQTTSEDAHGGYLDFHHSGSTEDYTTRIIEEAAGQLHISADMLRLRGVLAIANGAAGVFGDYHTVNLVTKSDVANDYKRSIQLMNKAYETDVADSLILIDKDSSGSRNYKLYGEHNKPTASDVGAVSKKLLWTNSNVFSQFAAQTITINSIADYDGIEIVYNTDVLDGAYTSTGFIPRETDIYFTMNNITSDGTPCLQKRSGQITSTGVRFKDGYECTIKESVMNVKNSACIPYKIYGVKGVV